MTSKITSSLHLEKAPISPCSIAYCQALEYGVGPVPVLAVEIGPLTVYFETAEQLNQLMAVIADGYTRLSTLIAEQNPADRPRPVSATEESDLEMARRDGSGKRGLLVMTWINGENGNRASVERWGSEDEARKALATLHNCSRCSDCSGCSDCSDCSGCSGCSRCSSCSGCSGCSGCSDCSGCSGCSGLEDASPQTEPRCAPPVPVIEDLHAKIYAAASQPGSLDMCDWHACENTHCRAGWAIALAGPEGYALERFHNPELAAMLIYDASCRDYKINPARFFDTNEDALADMKRLAGA